MSEESVKLPSVVAEIAEKLKAIHNDVQGKIHDQWDWMNASFFTEQLRTIADEALTRLAAVEGMPPAKAHVCRGKLRGYPAVACSMHQSYDDTSVLHVLYEDSAEEAFKDLMERQNRLAAIEKAGSEDLPKFRNIYYANEVIPYISALRAKLADVTEERDSVLLSNKRIRCMWCGWATEIIEDVDQRMASMDEHRKGCWETHKQTVSASGLEYLKHLKSGKESAEARVDSLLEGCRLASVFREQLRDKNIELEAQVEKLTAELDAKYSVGLCFICNEDTDPSSGDPGRWSMRLEYPDGNGERRTYHRSCVISAINKSAGTREEGLREAAGIVGNRKKNSCDVNGRTTAYIIEQEILAAIPKTGEKA